MDEWNAALGRDCVSVGETEGQAYHVDHDVFRRRIARAPREVLFFSHCLLHCMKNVGLSFYFWLSSGLFLQSLLGGIITIALSLVMPCPAACTPNLSTRALQDDRDA